MITYTDNPIEIFSKIFGQAQNNPHIVDASAACLATTSSQGRPSNRIILLKDYNDQGFVFYTNLNSRKAQHLHDNQYASLCFFWPSLGKQVRIEGKVATVDDSIADVYFASRDIGSQLGAWASKQSQLLQSTDDLHRRVTSYEQQWSDGKVPRPSFWSGFCLVPDLIEFWTEKPCRLHERIEYQLTSSGDWQQRLLFP